MTIQFANILIYILVFARLAGCILLSPIYGQNSIPMMFKMGFIMLLTLVIAPYIPNTLTETNFIIIIAFIFKELLIGAFLGFTLNIYLMMLAFISDIIDTQFGLAMAKTFDPATNIQNASVGAIMNYLFLLFFLASNSHLRLLELYFETYNYLGLSAGVNLGAICGFIFSVFLSAMELSIRLGLPFIGCEFIVEIALGILMKMIPQIHAFVINVQLKILVGLILLLLLAAPIGDFMNSYVSQAMDSMQSAVEVLGQ